jgi:hypothetical protein
LAAVAEVVHQTVLVSPEVLVVRTLGRLAIQREQQDKVTKVVPVVVTITVLVAVVPEAKVKTIQEHPEVVTAVTVLHPQLLELL